MKIKKLAALIIGFCLALTGTACISSEIPDISSDSTSAADELETNGVGTDKIETDEKETTVKNDAPDIPAGENQFKVDGTKIIAPDGGEFLIKGVNVNGPGWAFPRDTLQDLELIVDTWQFTTVRLCAAIGWEWAQSYNSDLDGIIKAFTDKHIVVILEVHDYTGIFPPDEGYRSENVKFVYAISDLKDWWIDKAKRFKENPYVWFNIMNEPGSDNSKQSADLWLKIHDEIIESIRGTGADNIIVLDEHNWGQGSGYHGGKSSYDSAIIRMGPALNEKYDNLVYSLHVYDSWRDGKLRFDNYFKDAHELGLCVILGEFGVGKENLGQHNAVKAMYNSAIPNNIGRIYWAWDDRGLPLTESVSGCGWEINRTDGEKPNNLTWVGELVWLDNRGLLNAPVPEYNLMLPLLPNGNFEDDMNGWQDWGGTSVQDGISYDGTKALSIASDNTGGAGRSLELKANTSYRFSAWGKNDTRANPGADVGVKYRDALNPEQEQHCFVSFTETEWSQKSIVFTTPDEFSGATLFIWKGDANSTFYLDDLELTETPVAIP